MCYIHTPRKRESFGKNLLKTSENEDMQHLQFICIIKLALLRYSSQTEFEFVFLSLSRKRIWVKMVIYILAIFKHKITKQWKQYNAVEFSLLKQLFFRLLTVLCFPSKACTVLGKYEDQE